ncbi:flagellin [Solibacillus sp. FSL W7-1464]|uniref:flagellin N-terminal helical domain-containing protein n=1 Tax=Solibacillus sp. FSL W7-1464 TaxID=2921706 RepID=UPI0030FCC851
MRINHNIAALNTHRQLNTASTAQSKSMEKLSSGLRINKAGDDAAGLAISEKMRGQIRGLDMASKNAQDGISLIQTAEGALNETHDILQRMRELAVQSSNDTNTDTDRDELQKEVDQLANEITRIAENTEFNTQNLLGGSFENKVFHIGANDGQNIKLSIGEMSAHALGVSGKVEGLTASTAAADIALFKSTANADISATAVLKDEHGNIHAVSLDGNDKDATWYRLSDIRVNTTDDDLEAKPGATALTASENADDTDLIDLDSGKAGIDISTQGSADAAMKLINDAIETVSAERSKLGATQNRLEHTINNLNTSSENLTAAESRIRDVDYALAA